MVKGAGWLKKSKQQKAELRKHKHFQTNLFEISLKWNAQEWVGGRGE